MYANRPTAIATAKSAAPHANGRIVMQRVEAAEMRPNVLLIVTDQHRADHLGCYGNPVLRTPHVDALADRGVAFDRFYVAAPICMPNRATLVTGRMPSAHGVRSNGIPLALDQRTFVEQLRDAGYATALVGKSHLQNMLDVPPVWGPRAGGSSPVAEARRGELTGEAYEQESPARWRDPAFRMRLPYYGFDHVELAIDHGDLVEGEYRRWLVRKGADPEALVGRANALPAERPRRVPQAWRTRVPEELYPTSFVAERTIAYLEAHAAQRPSAPFFVMCSFPDPHHPFTPPGRYWDLYDPAGIEAPATCGPPPPDAPPPLRRLHEERAAGRAQVESPSAFAVDAAEAREAIALTYGMIAMVDDAIGRIVDALRRLGVFERTLVVFTADHGDFMGDHGLLLKGPLHYQGLVRVPFIWADPRDAAPARRSDALAGTLDLAPTILDYAGVAPYHGMQGTSLLPALAGGPSPRAALLVEEDGQRPMFGFDDPPRVRTLVTARERLSVYAGAPWGELYDLAEDPLECRNCWDDRARRGALLELLAQTSLAIWDRSPAPTRRA